ncbi:MAG: GAF domain-containing protein, partial [Thermoanaerobaculia bacterium]|nr:GAF domain-containing protein [Thermoanaerobaculia bacterium]
MGLETDPARSPAAPGANAHLNHLPQLWGRRGFWQIRLRWAVAPVMIAGVLIGQALGFELRALPILASALASPVYNALFAWIFSRQARRPEPDPRLDRWLVLLEVVVDYVAMLALVHFTGGASSPLALFLLFHVIIGAVQFSQGTAFLFAGLAAAGLWALHWLHVTGLLPSHGLALRGEPLDLLDRPAHAAVFLVFFTATLFLTAAMVSRIMRQLRGRVDALARASAELVDLNTRLHSLYAIVRAIGRERHLAPILETVARELAKVIEVPAASVKLLSEDGRTLRYVASFGLPEDLVENTVIELDQSPPNRRVVEGETLVQGLIGGDENLQLQDELAALGIRSAVFAPLRIESRVIGTLGVYAHSADRFSDRDSEFLKLAAELVALAIEDAQANEALERMMQERTQFLLKVAHNLRAPLSAGLSMLELMEGGLLGPVTAAQSDHLRRVADRLHALDRAIGQLLTIARTRDLSREIPDVVVDLEDLAAQTERTFRDEAEHKGVDLAIAIESGLPVIDSGVDLLKELMENLVSNAIKYTPAGGEVRVRFERGDAGEVRLTVRDTGIGIPEREQEKLFQEFFRASNAKKHSPAGTGLGLALVKQTVERHHG